MALNIATFKTRTLSALIFVVIMLAGLLWNQWSFFALFTIVHFGCWNEYNKLMGKIDPAYANIPAAWKIGFPVLGWGGMWWAIRGIPPTEGRLVFAGYLGTSFMVAGALLILAGFLARQKKGGRNIWYALLGLFYISLAWFVMILLRSVGEGILSIASLFGEPSRNQVILVPAALPCALIFSMWINDTMAYIVGSFIGRTPFSPISPKKTWEGTLGGAILCVGVMTLVGYYAGPSVGLYPLRDWIAISGIAAVAGTAGDLLESKLKRMAGVKDSGQILPGHGGFLDRFDSLLLATPLVYVYFLLAGL